MSDLPPIGSTIALHGGTIQRTADNRFTVIRADGKRDNGCNRAAKPEIMYAVAVNILRSHADLELLPLPCLHCLVKPRRGTNAFCSGQCEALHYGYEPRPVRERKGKTYQPKREQPLPPLPVILERLHRIAPESLLSAVVNETEPVQLAHKCECGTLLGKRYADVTGVNPDYAAWKADADELIARREQERIP